MVGGLETFDKVERIEVDKKDRPLVGNISLSIIVLFTRTVIPTLHCGQAHFNIIRGKNHNFCLYYFLQFFLYFILEPFIYF